MGLCLSGRQRVDVGEREGGGSGKLSLFFWGNTDPAAAEKRSMVGKGGRERRSLEKISTFLGGEGLFSGHGCLRSYQQRPAQEKLFPAAGEERRDKNKESLSDKK